MKTIKQISLIMLFLIAVACNTKKAKQPVQNSSQQLVRIVRPKEIPKFIVINGTGKLASSAEIKLSFKVSGIIDRIDVQSGQKVKPGQLLAQINQSEIQANLNKAQQVLDKANRDMIRIKNMYQDSSATLEQYQDVQTAYHIAQSNYDIADYNAKHSRIIAPTYGTILNKYTEQGELISAGSPIFSFGKSNQVETQVLELSVVDKDLIHLQMNDSAAVSFSALPNQTYSGKITEIAQVANPNTGTYQVKITLTKGFYPELKNGFIGKAAIYSQSSDELLAIPLKALVEGNGNKATIYTTKDQKTVELNVIEVIDFKEKDFIIKANQLPVNVQIITEGAQYLSPEDSIKILN